MTAAEGPGINWLLESGLAIGGLALLVWWIAPRVSGLLEYQRERVKAADASLQERLERAEAEVARLQEERVELVRELAHQQGMARRCAGGD